MNHPGFPGQAGEAFVCAAVSIGQFQMIESEEVEQGSLKIVDVDGIPGGLPSDFVGFTVIETGLNPSASHEHGEGIGVVVPSGVGFSSWSVFPEGGTSELSAPDYQCLIEETPLLEIGNKSSDWLVAHACIEFKFLVQVGMLVP